jgi:hypothetical protein
MNTSIKSGIVLGIGALLLVLSTASGQEKDFDIVGDYSFEGTEDGAGFSGTAKITAHGDAFEIRYSSETVENGVGIFDGETFSVCFVSEDDDSMGIVVFKLQDDNKTLVGNYAYFDGDGALHPETLTKIE